MAYEYLQEACAQKKGAEVAFYEPWDCVRALVGGKMFAMIGEDNQGEPIITLKSKPEDAEILRLEYEDIIPGYYMNKTHWNSVLLKGNVSQEVIIKLIEQSYDLVFAALPKKVQAAIGI